MKYEIRLSGNNAKLMREVKVRSGVDLAKCYQCGECTAGCPMTPEMDAGPAKVLRFIQLGMEDALFKLNTPWLCASCETCTSRCPNSIDIAQIMDVVRQMTRIRGKKIPVKDPAIFQDVFLKSMEVHGKLYEPGLIGFYNMKSMNPFHDVVLAPKMFLKGKLHLWPPFSKNREKVKEIFEKAAAHEKAKTLEAEKEDDHGHG